MTELKSLLPSKVHLKKGAGLALDWESLAKGRKVVLVTDTCVPKGYVEDLLKVLAQHASDVWSHALPAGDAHKTYDSLSHLFEGMLARQMGRDCLVVGLGGGQVGDMAGLAASLYQRGVELVLIPTTLLSQIDAALGGKVAVNFQGYKNMLGAFWHASHIAVDPTYLQTESEEGLQSGLGELLKYSYLDPVLQPLLARFEPIWQSKGAKAALEEDIELTTSLIQAALRIKIQHVVEDERDLLGQRAKLNLGHTFAHGLEMLNQRGQLSREGPLAHGLAVALGIDCAAKLSAHLALIASDEAETISKRVASLGFWTSDILSSWRVDPAAYFASLRRDKKTTSNTLRLVLFRSSSKGPQACLESVEDAALMPFLASLCQSNYLLP